MAIKPVSGEIKAQVLNDNLSYLDSKTNQMIGGPKETFTNVGALQAKYPSGDSHVMLVTDSGGANGYLYSWNGVTWVKGPLYQSQGIADRTVTKPKLNFSPYNRLIFKRANFDVNQYCDFDDNGNYTIVEDAAGQNLHNYRIYADQEGVGQAVRVTAQHHINDNGSTRIFLGTNEHEIIFANILKGEAIGSYIMEIHSISKGVLKPSVFPPILNAASPEAILKLHSVTLRQIGHYLAIYFNDVLISLLNSKTYFSTSFTVSGAIYRGTAASGKSRVKTIDAENLITPYPHMSIDDVNSILRDLHDNRATYTSIFDNPNLAFLKLMHDKYGMVVSLYLFKQTSTFDISDMTTKYRVEFAENSHWLKFGFHSRESGVNYNTADPTVAVADYTSVIDAIYNFAVPSSLDVIPRFENFGMKMDCQHALIAAGLPFEGTYGADDTRELSAGLTGKALTLIQNGDYYFDPKLQLFYPRSEYRMDGATSDTIVNQLDNLYKDTANNKLYGLFWHQGSELRPTQQGAIETACQWLVAKGVRFDFPQNNKPVL